jgi:hypothetical protein
MRHRKPPRYVSAYNPDTKRFINTCSVCGQQGYAPQVLESNFVTDLVRQAMRDVLVRNYQPMPLDELGRCVECRRVAESGSA